MICRHSTYRAIVDCLCNLLPEAHIAENGRSAVRTQPERDAIYFLHRIISFDVVKALEAGVISRWLARYPFGGSDASRYKRKDAILRLRDSDSDHEDSEFGSSMCQLLLYISKNPSLRKEMVVHGLLDVPDDKETLFDVCISRYEYGS